MSSFTDILRDCLEQENIAYDEEKLGLCLKYRDFLLAKNRVMNLTGLTEDRDMAVKNFLDSLLLLKYGDIAEGSSLLDIGSGAGFPGMVCRIFRPDLKISLMDSLTKRCDFLRELCAELGIEDVEILCGRAEEFGRNPSYRGSFDYVTARAVAAASVLLEYGIPLLKQGGRLIMLKGKEEEEIPARALTELCATALPPFSYELTGDKRSLLMAEKQEPTPDKYPRRPGIPAKRPLN